MRAALLALGLVGCGSAPPIGADVSGLGVPVEINLDGFQFGNGDGPARIAAVRSGDDYVVDVQGANLCDTGGLELRGTRHTVPYRMEIAATGGSGCAPGQVGQFRLTFHDQRTHTPGEIVATPWGEASIP